MNIGIDFHDTLSYSPDFFIELIRLWKGKIYIVTGTPASRKNEISEGLNSLKITEDMYDDILCGFEYDKSDMTLDHFKRMADHKLDQIRSHDISVYYDDNPFYVKKMKDNGVITFQTIIDEKYLKEFEEKDPFFTCNLQKLQFDYLDDLSNDSMLKDDSERDK